MPPLTQNGIGRKCNLVGNKFAGNSRNTNSPFCFFAYEKRQLLKVRANVSTRPSFNTPQHQEQQGKVSVSICFCAVSSNRPTKLVQAVARPSFTLLPFFSGVSSFPGFQQFNFPGFPRMKQSSTPPTTRVLVAWCTYTSDFFLLVPQLSADL